MTFSRFLVDFHLLFGSETVSKSVNKQCFHQNIVFPVSYLNMNWVNEQVSNTGSGEPLVWKIHRKKHFIYVQCYLFLIC